MLPTNSPGCFVLMFFFVFLHLFCNSCSNIPALLFAPAEPKGCLNAGSAKLPSGQIFCPWVLTASAELLPQVPTSLPSCPKPQLCNDHTHTQGTCCNLHQLEAPSTPTGNTLPLSLCHTIIAGNTKEAKQKGF